MSTRYGGRDADHFRPRPTIDHALRSKVKQLEAEVERLVLSQNALWEIARDRLNITEDVLIAKMKEIDLRDGVADGKVTQVPLGCPSCGRVSSSRHWKCLYCGLEFERDVQI